MSTDAEKIAKLNQDLVQAGVSVAGLAVQEHNLESVFMEISQREEAGNAE
jgi:hypothetical protein